MIFKSFFSIVNDIALSPKNSTVETFQSLVHHLISSDKASGDIKIRHTDS